MKLDTYTFPSGLRLVYEEVEDTRPAGIYIGVGAGSANENEKNLGISHFIEHMSFKGTKKREGKDIARNFEEIGATVNAYTSVTTTCYYATGLSEKFEEMLELLSDLVFFSTYKEEDIETERKVIFEEIDMNEDDPERVVYQSFNDIFYSGSKISMNALGTKECLNDIGRKEIIEYVKEHYVPNKIVISVVKSRTIVPDKKFISIKKDVTQTLVIFGFPTDNVFSTDFMTNQVLSYILGGTMGSRLFRHVRDDEGLVYSIESSVAMREFGGDFCVSFGTNDKNAKKAVELVKCEINELLSNGIEEKELERAKTYFKSLLLYGNETSSRIARKNMNNILVLGRIIDIKETLDDIEAVTIDGLMRVAKKVFNYSNVCGSVVSKTINEEIFECLE